MSGELEQLDGLIARLAIVSPRVCGELRADPGRAIRVLEYALQQPGLRSRASYAVAQFRSGFDPARQEQTRLDSGPGLTVSELEGALRWARRHRTTPDCIPAIEAELDLARAREQLLDEARAEAAR